MAVLIATFTATLVPALAPAAPLGQTCNPRPPVGVNVVTAGVGRLQVTLNASTNASTPTNSLLSLVLTPSANAMVDVPSEPDKTPPLGITLPPNTQQYSFYVRQLAPNQATTVNLTVTDACGAWPTFVGGGPSVFAAPSPTPTATSTVPAGSTATPTRTATVPPGSTATPTRTPTVPAGSTATPTSTSLATSTATASPTTTRTPTPTNTSTATATPTPMLAELSALKSNNVSGATTLPNSWTWRVSVRNVGSTAATFAAGQTILTDNLPNANVAYGPVTLANVTNVTGQANINCAISGSDLSCTATGGPVTLGPSTGYFDVQFTATPSAIGTFANPRAGGICRVDPGNLVTESTEGNNDCAANSVTVTAPDMRVGKSNNVSGNVVVGQPWTWLLTIVNHDDTAPAVFATNAVLLTDNLPNANVGYSNIVVTKDAGVQGTVACTIDVNSDLSCTANGAVSIPPSGSVAVAFTATPTAPGTYGNPRAGGTCRADPNGVIAESDEANNTCPPNSVTVTAPDLTVTKSNNVGGNVVLPNGWTWTLTVANGGNGPATFTTGQTILTDDLPSGPTYGTVTVTPTNVSGGGTADCSVGAGPTLTCTANGTVSLGATTGQLAIAVPVTPVAAGTFANPRAGGACAVDPGTVVPETNEGNNACATNSVVVTVPPPVANADSYSAYGNVQIAVGSTNNGVLGNDTTGGFGTNVVTHFGPNGTESAAGATGAATQGGSSLSVNANGTFTYNPPAGFRGPTDTFKYTVSNGAASAVGTATVTILDVNGATAGMPLVWFVDDTADAGSDGRATHKFDTLGAFQAINDGAPGHGDNGDFIYVMAGSYTGAAVTLRPSQQLLGNPVDLTVVLPTRAMLGVTAHGEADSLPGTGTKPTLANAGTIVTLPGIGGTSTIDGVDLSASAGYGISGTGNGATTVSNVAITSSAAGGGVVLSNPNGTFNFTAGNSISANGTDRGNTIGTQGTAGSGSVVGRGMQIQNEGSININAVITGNIVQEVTGNQGINVQHGIAVAGVAGTTNATITNNTVRQITGGSRPLNTEILNTGTLCTDIQGNNLSTPGQGGSTSVLRLNRTNGTYNNHQNGAAGLAADNTLSGGGTVTVSGTIVFNHPTCAQPSPF